MIAGSSPCLHAVSTRVLAHLHRARWPEWFRIRTERWPNYALVCKPEVYCSQAATPMVMREERGGQYTTQKGERCMSHPRPLPIQRAFVVQLGSEYDRTR